MGQQALLVTQSGSITTGLLPIARDQYDTVETIVTDGSEDGTYYLAPSVVEQVAQRLKAHPVSVLVIDGIVHPGQAVDLAERFPSVTTIDRRELVWQQLSDDTPVAALQCELRRCRIDRRRAAAAARDGGPDTPSGTSGQQTALDRRVADLRNQIEDRQHAARRRLTDQYTGVDGHVVLLGRPGAPTASLWASLTGEIASSRPCRPAQARTALATVGPHTVALTDTPGVPGETGLPDWFTRIVPGVAAALDRATVVVGVGDQAASLVAAVDDRVDGVCRGVDAPDTDRVRAVIDEVLGRESYRLRLPYSDATHALLAELHDDAVVNEVTYEDEVNAVVTVSAPAAAALCRRVEDIGGVITPAGD